MNLEFFNSNAESLRLLGLMVSQHGQLLEKRFYDTPCRRIVWSVSKSFTGAAVGFAVQEGLLHLDEKIVDLFPDILPDHVDENLSKATIRHALTMTLGQKDSHLMADGRCELPNEDWAKYALAIPFDYEPGTRFVYSNVGPYLAGLAVQKRAGCNLVDYLMPRLFQPLGIKLPTWEVDPMGRTFGASGLMLSLPEIHKFGQLYLHNGCWDGKQLLDPQWVAESRRKQADNPWGGYGYLFWLDNYNSYRADGMYGQFSIILPDQDAVISATAESRESDTLLDLLMDKIVPQL